jgi:hypothetical protein
MPARATSPPAPPPDMSGVAVVMICESLPLALKDGIVLAGREIVGLPRDGVVAQANDPGDDGETARHGAVARPINGLVDGRNSVRCG